MREKFLPIGSVVLLKGGTKKAMITGFCSIAEEDKTKVYDYSGCVYPEGYLNSNQICLFDHDQIEEIFFIGYEDEEEKEFKKELSDIIIQYNNGEIDISSDDSLFESDIDDASLNDEDEAEIDIEQEDLEYL